MIRLKYEITILDDEVDAREAKERINSWLMEGLKRDHFDGFKIIPEAGTP